MKILVTGFAPFGGENVNPAYAAVLALPQELGGAQILKQELPTEFGAAGRLLAKAIAAQQPQAVVCVGQAGGSRAIAVERVAINLRDARIPDNAGCQPVDEPIRPGGPAAYFTRLPAKAIVRALRQAGLPAVLSNTAGTYVCNEVMYTLLDLIERQYPALRGGFIHVPYSQEQLPGKPEGTPALPLAQITQALTVALWCLLREDPA